MVSRNGFAELLHRPMRCRVRRDIDMQDATGGMFHHDKDIEQAKRGCDDDAEVARDDRPGMVADKGSPTLRGRALPSAMIHALGHILAHGAWRYPQPKLEAQLIGDTFLTPRGVVPGHTADKRLEVRRYRGTPRGGLPAPEEPKPLLMPPGKRVWLHNGQPLTPVEPATEPDQSETGRIGRTSGLHVTLLIQRQLFPQEEVFCCKGRGRTKTKPEEPPDIDDKREQRGSDQYEVTEQT
jgi:hypothetical protein